MVARIIRTLIQVISLLAMFCIASAQSTFEVGNDYRRGDFKLVSGNQAADIVVAPEDFKVVQIATRDFRTDVNRVTGQTPRVLTGLARVSEYAVLIGTLGQSKLIDDLVKSGRLDVSQLKGSWESFLIATIPEPLPHVTMGLVIVGSDRRGTAFGIYELSQAIGVSPWNWWADVTPQPRKDLVVGSGLHRFGPPSVKYRGIFLNDEDWGLQPWAAKTYEPERGDIGPKTYARIFELLLRLKANTLWPAMHACTRPFNGFPENKQVADDYAIVMGSSHAEPMLRNNVGEWKAAPEDYDYTKNPNGVRQYWEDRVSENARFENIYTIGMRGIHDSPIQGPRSAPERIALLEQIFAVQRDLISKRADRAAEHVPQIFCPYKEVLTDYQNGLKVPDDVTIVFPDDNFGYIRYLPTAAERKRSGGFGIYYHISYLGRPLSYLWLNTTPPSLIWEEMSKAYEHGVDRFWMLNVGDLKPAEIGIEFFMQLAWDSKRWRRDNLSQFLSAWARREFGPNDADEIASIMRKFYELGLARRPEHLQWPEPKPDQPSASTVTTFSEELSPFNYGDEAQARLDAYEDLVRRADRLYAKTSSQLRDALYELVVYPVRGAALVNQRYLLMRRSKLYATQGRASALSWAKSAEAAGLELAKETRYYNEVLAGGKWRHIMSVEMTPGQWPSMRTDPPSISHSVMQMEVPDAAGLGVIAEGWWKQELRSCVPTVNAFTREQRFVDIFNRGRAAAPWTATSKNDWIKLSQMTGNLNTDTRISIAIDWERAPKGQLVWGSIEINGAGSSHQVLVPVFNPLAAVNTEFVESAEYVSIFDPLISVKTKPAEAAGFVSMEAEHFTRKVDRGGAGWDVIPNLGRTGDSVAVFPTTTPSVDVSRVQSDAPVLQFDMTWFDRDDDVFVFCYLLPTRPLRAGVGLRYAIGIDDETPQVVNAAAVEVQSYYWSQMVLNASAVGLTTLHIKTPGRHVLKLYMIDPGVVVDKLVVASKWPAPSYLGPRETRTGSAGVPPAR